MKNIVEKVIEKEYLMKNFLKKFCCIMIAMIMAEIFLTACGGREEEETETTLPYITWDDSHSGSYETWLHFSFSDGAEFDKELQCSPSIIEKVDFAEKEYDMPVFMMESYEKEHALAYTDKRVLVGYQGGGWQILEWFDCPKPDFE